MSRNSSIELFRIALMLGICFLHSVKDGLYCTGWLANIMMPCVTGFVFITGWYGIRFNWHKIVKLLGILAGCLPSIWVIKFIFNLDIDVAEIVYRVRYCWFLWAYLALMLFAPILNVAVEHAEHLKIVAPTIFLALGWSYLTEVPVAKEWLPKPVGFGNFTFLMMIGVYLVARIWNKHQYLIGNRWRNKVLLGASLGLMVLAASGFGKYASPVSAGLAGILFILFSRIKLSDSIGKAVNYIAPSMFAVYILHTNKVGFAFMRSMESQLHNYGVPVLGIYVITATTLFVICVVADICIRRLLLVGLIKLIVKQVNVWRGR